MLYGVQSDEEEISPYLLHFVHVFSATYHIFSICGYFCPIPTELRNKGMALSFCAFIRQLFKVTVHYWTECSSDWAHTLLMHSLWDFPDTNKFWSHSADFTSFLGLCSFCTFQDKLGGCIYYETPHTCFTFLQFRESPLFQGLWLVEQLSHISRKIASQIDLKLGIYLHYQQSPGLSVAVNYRYSQYKSIWKFRSIIDMDFSISKYRVSNLTWR